MLYLISYKIEDLFDVFYDNQRIFEDIKNTLGQNRRVNELIDSNFTITRSWG